MLGVVSEVVQCVFMFPFHRQEKFSRPVIYHPLLFFVPRAVPRGAPRLAMNIVHPCHPRSAYCSRLVVRGAVEPSRPASQRGPHVQLVCWFARVFTRECFLCRGSRVERCRRGFLASGDMKTPFFFSLFQFSPFNNSFFSHTPPTILQRCLRCPARSVTCRSVYAYVHLSVTTV